MKDETPDSRPIVVAIAASAGGLEATSVLLQRLPDTSAACYVVAQHMSPSHKSLLSTLLSRETKLNVIEIEEDLVPKANTIYITPPNADVIIEGGVLKLVAPAGHAASPKPSGDRLFKSIADDRGEACVGIVLSGTGSDGSYGVQAIREAGGITIAQNTATAKYDGMPNSAIETGCIDLTLAPEQIGEHLERILTQPRDLESFRHITEQPSHLSDLLQILLARTRVDFREYKENTVYRRIARRIAALGISTYEEYVNHCRTSPEEVDALHRDLLISVTRFFRDPGQYKQLEHAVTNLVGKVDKRPLRVWVAGVATGEEAYSIAILMAEALGGIDALRRNQVQIFATDIDTRALDIARAGTYPITALQDIPEHLRDTYFNVHLDKVSVHPDLRSVILFSDHNVFQDPPFLNIDVVSLRNVLIYFNATLQEKVLTRLHYALADNGILFLGTSETASVLDAYFELASGTDKVFVKRRLNKREAVNDLRAKSPMTVPSSSYLTNAVPSKREPQISPNELFEALLAVVVQRGFVATRSGEIVRVLGDVSDVISLNADTTLRMNVRLLKPQLRDDAANLIAVSHRSAEPRAGSWVDRDPEGLKQIRLVCYPIKLDRSGEYTFVLGIQERERSINPGRHLGDLSDSERLAYLDEIEREMMSMRESLQQTVEELQTSNEELQSANEELQSTNEELQASNEELETSNEELQSTNEELITVNEELQINSQSLDRVTTELQATFASVEAPMFMIDEALQIQQASGGALALLGYKELPTQGVHLSQFPVPEGISSLVEACVQSMQRNKVIHLQSSTLEAVTSVTLVPFEASRHGGHGLTVTIARAPLVANTKLISIADQFSDMGHWILHVPTTMLHWSKNVFLIHGRNPDGPTPTLKSAIDAYHPSDRQNVEDIVNKAIEEGGTYDFQARIIRADTGLIVPVRSRGETVSDENGQVIKLVGVFRDITNDIIFDQFKEIQDRSGAGFYSFDIANNNPYWSKSLYALLGYDFETHTPSSACAIEMIAEADRDRVAALLQRAIDHGEPYEYEANLLRKDGSEFLCKGFGCVQKDGQGNATHVYGGFEPMTV
ncbi:MAG: PAS domain-containing protein [Marinovum sp.]|nr:PAS domain-containing protein [Marinovum sp.]